MWDRVCSRTEEQGGTGDLGQGSVPGMGVRGWRRGPGARAELPAGR